MTSALRRMCVTLLFALLAAACAGGDGGEDSTGGPDRQAADDAVAIAVDTDLAIDDLVALAFLLSSREADVRAVAISGTGEVRCPQGLEVIRSLLAVTGDDQIPVACGRSTPLAGDHVFPPAWRDLADSGWGLDLTNTSGTTADESAAELLSTTLRQGGVTLLTLGPLTNVAEAMRAEPDLADEVASIVVMGGALDVPGNVFEDGSESPTAEWNMYVDPVAAAEVLASGAPIVLVGLDATRQVPITGDFLELLGANTQTEAARLVDMLIRNNPQVYSGEAYFWDPLAAAVAVSPGLVATEEVAVEVVTTPGRDIGRMVRSDDGTAVTIARRPRAAPFQSLLLRTLNHLEADTAVTTPPPPVGRASIRFDGSTCRYDGPATVPSGRMRFTFATTDPTWTGGVAGLTGERSTEMILAWIKEHPDPESLVSVPGVRDVTPVPPGFAMYVDVTAPRVAVICAPQSPLPLLAGTVTVE